MSDRVKILLVDDRPENLVALEAILDPLDHELMRARSGEEALKALLSEEVALILLDVGMPGMDGFETAAHIKRRHRTRDIPIIFLTAVHDDPSHAFRGYSSGAADYITKPFDPWMLRAKVAVFVDLYLKTRQVEEQQRLLNARLTELGAGAAAELAGRLAAVQKQFGELRDRIPVDAEPVAQELAERLDGLRETVDGLGGRAADPA